MAPSASKQKRLAEKAAKQAAKSKGASLPSDTATDTTGTGTSTPTEGTSAYGGSASATPLTSRSAATSQEDLTTGITSMAKLQIATDRSVPGLSLLAPCRGYG